MKLLFDAHHLGQRQTGNETWTRNLVLALNERAGDGEVEFAVTAAARPELAALTDAVPHLLSPRAAVRLVRDLPRAARTSGADVILVSYAMPLTARLCIVFVHDLSLEDPRAAQWVPAMWRTSHRMATRVSARRAAHVLAPSEFTRSQVVSLLGVPPERVSVAPEATDRSLEALLASAAPRPPTGRLRVLTVGNVVPRKNLIVLARAVRALAEEGSAIELRIVGQVPPGGERVAGEITGLLGPAVSFTGYVTPAELAVEYRSADVFCFPSLFEGFGLPLLEAMTAGTPVVASSSTSLPEVAGDAALVVAPHDVGAWRDALRRVASDEALRRSLVERGRRRAQQFTWSAAADVVLGTARRLTEPVRA